MPPLNYHAGQIALQTETRTNLAANQLAGWVGPAAEFAPGADSDNSLAFFALSGAPPFVEILYGSERVRLRFPDGLAPANYGWLVINLTNAGRASQWAVGKSGWQKRDGTVWHAKRLRGVLYPRKRLEHRLKVTSRPTTSQQAPDD